MTNLVPRIVWGASVLAVIFLAWSWISSWDSAADGWAFLVSARDAIEPFYNSVADFITGALPSNT